MADVARDSHGHFLKGHGGTQGAGRPLGSKNANTIIRDYFRNASVELFPDFLMALRSIRDSDPKGFVDGYLKMTERVVPRLATLRMEDEREGNSASTHLLELSSWNNEITSKQKEEIKDAED